MLVIIIATITIGNLYSVKYSQQALTSVGLIVLNTIEGFSGKTRLAKVIAVSMHYDLQNKLTTQTDIQV